MNAFASLLSGGQQAANGFGGVLRRVSDAGAQAFPELPYAQQQRADAAASDAQRKEQLAQLGRLAAYGDTLADPEMRRQYAEDVINLVDFDDDVADKMRQAAGMNGGFQSLYQAYVGGDQGNEESFGVTPQFIRQPDGSVRAVQFGNRGTVRTQDAGGTPIPLEQRDYSNDLRRQQIDLGYYSAAPQTRGAQAEATALGTEAGKIQAEDLPRSARETRQGQLRVAARSSRVKLISDTIDKAIEQSNAWNTGPIAGRSPFATNLQSTLDTVAANIGFEELQRLRDNSKTGGALGNVSERENILLQSVLGSIARSQNERQLDDNLRRAKLEIIGSWNRIAAAYEQDYGRPYEGETPEASNPQPSGPQPGTIEDGYRFLGGDPADPNNWERAQ